MFLPERWAAAFVDTLGADAGGKTGGAENRAVENLEEGIEALKSMAPCIKKIRGFFGGTNSAGQIERMMRKAAGSGFPLPDRNLEITIRFIALLVKRNLFHRIDAVILQLERILDEKKGILPVILESAFPADKDFQDSLVDLLLRKTGAARIRLETRQESGLLGGYRLIIHTSVIDASLRSQLRNMADYISFLP
jgi:F0F1-type ATP synthase delta subunit